MAALSWLTSGLFRSSSSSSGGPAACPGSSPNSSASKPAPAGGVAPAFELDGLEFWETLEVVSRRDTPAPVPAPAPATATAAPARPWSFLPLRAAGVSYQSVMSISPDGVDVEPLAAMPVAQAPSKAPSTHWTGLSCYVEVAGDGVDFDLAAAH